MEETEDIHPRMYLYRRIVEAKCFIDRHFHERIELSTISDQAHFSRYHFLRLFKETYGKSPHKYLREVRLSHARKLLAEQQTVQEVCTAVGFESVPSFVNLFRREEGITPNQYRRLKKEEQERSTEQPLAFVPNCFASNFGWTK